MSNESARINVCGVPVGLLRDSQMKCLAKLNGYYTADFLRKLADQMDTMAKEPAAPNSIEENP